MRICKFVLRSGIARYPCRGHRGGALAFGNRIEPVSLLGHRDELSGRRARHCLRPVSELVRLAQLRTDGASLGAVADRCGAAERGKVSAVTVELLTAVN